MLRQQQNRGNKKDRKRCLLNITNKFAINTFNRNIQQQQHKETLTTHPANIDRPKLLKFLHSSDLLANETTVLA